MIMECTKILSGFIIFILFFCIFVIFVNSTHGQQYKIKINTIKSGESISKYIYGQFIEHLGRCIYGGIWAEMLEDRKFYYPITDNFNPWAKISDPSWNAGPYKYLNASPWQVIGASGTVTMETKAPFVGMHTPVIHIPAKGNEVGIRQYGLAVEKGESYTGRIILSGDNKSLQVSVRLILDNGEILTNKINNLSTMYKVYPLKFTTSSSNENVSIEVIGKGKGNFKIGTISLMPSNNIKGWRKDVIALLKELNSPVYRWPGGNFVSGYNWRDGIGERDKRPPRKNPAWKGVESNDVGIHEYMELMDIINAEAFIAVNTGLGTVKEIIDEVQYCNGAIDTSMGKLRAKNGHPDPYNVKWWAVGNEMYGSWQLGRMPLGEYVEKHKQAAKGMWDVDKSIKLVGVGEVGRWSETMLRRASDYMNLISEHIYCKEQKSIIPHTEQLANEIKYKAAAHRMYRSQIKGLSDKDIRIAMDEWNYWYGDYIYGELGVRYHLKDGLGIAKGLHEFFRNSDIYYMANYAQTVNVIGAIKTTRTAAAFETTGLVLKLYRNNFGTLPLTITGNTDDLDVFAAWTLDKKALTMSIVNPTDKTGDIVIKLIGKRLNGEGKLWLITHSDPMAYNEPGRKQQVMIEEKQLKGFLNNISVPPFSVNLYRFSTNR